ncbi:MAG: tRNA pseudouridine(55) synthase TruB [Cellulosilyticaceae bacterium]
MIHGIINIYKEKGFTSHDVVAKARGILREKKIGHTGTLDPEAQGVLPICIGRATKVVPYLTDADKCYEAEVILGSYTTTEDATGEILETYPVAVTQDQIREVVASFIGDYVQTPPMYSAIKVGGVRLYELARAGKVVERPSRQVQIYSCDILEFLDEKRFKIRVNCSKGTYIRTLCTDIGKKLGCGAHMGELLRTKVGAYTLTESITLGELEERKCDLDALLHTMDSVFMDYPAYTVKATAQKAIINGNPIPLTEIDGTLPQTKQMVRLYTESEDFIGVYHIDQPKGYAVVEKLFLTS